METKPVELYRRICKAASKDGIDLPMLVFYDSSAADDEREMSEDSSEKLFEMQSLPESVNQYDELPLSSNHQSPSPLPNHHRSQSKSGQSRLDVPSGRPTDEENTVSHAIEEKDNGGGRITPNHDDPQKAAKPLSNLVRAAVSGCGDDSKLFPPTIPPPLDAGEEDKSIATHPSFLAALRKVQNTHQVVVLNKEDMVDFADYLDKTSLGDYITTVALLP